MKVARTYHLRAMTRTYRFGSFELDLAAYVLKARGEIVRLEKIPMEVLILLVQRAGMLVERSHIAAAVWGSGVFVEQEAAINTAVRKIRQVLGDDAAVPRFVQTVVGKGYRFIATVENFSAAGESVGNPSAVQSGCPRYVVKVGRQEFVLPSGETVIGREQGDLVFTDDPFMSRRHAAITIDRASRRFVLRDLGSSNGTAVRFRGERALRPGDQFRVGRHLFRFESGATGQNGR